MADRSLTILEVTHAGHQAGSTFLIHSLCAPLVKRGHRVLVGCRPDSLLAKLAADAGLPVVPLDFGRLGPLAGELARVIGGSTSISSTVTTAATAGRSRGCGGGAGCPRHLSSRATPCRSRHRPS